MGFKIYREVMDHAPDDLTWQQRYILLVLADDANDETRICVPCFGGESAHAVKTRRRVRCSDKAFYRAVKALTDAGLLESVERGHNGRSAVYRVMPMPSATVDDTADRSEPEAVASQFSGGYSPTKGPSFGEATGDGKPPLSRKVASPFEASSLPKNRTPIPQSPQYTSDQSQHLSVGSADPGPASLAERDHPRSRRQQLTERLAGADREDLDAYIDELSDSRGGVMGWGLQTAATTAKLEFSGNAEEIEDLPDDVLRDALRRTVLRLEQPDGGGVPADLVPEFAWYPS